MGQFTFNKIAGSDANAALLFAGVRFDAYDGGTRHGDAAIGVRIGGTDSGTVADDVAGIAETFVCNTQCEHWG